MIYGFAPGPTPKPHWPIFRTRQVATQAHRDPHSREFIRLVPIYYCPTIGTGKYTGAKLRAIRADGWHR